MHPKNNLPKQPLVIYITDAERSSILAACHLLKQQFGTIDNPKFLNFLAVEAHEHLPRRIRRILTEFRHAYQSNDYGAIVFRNFIEVDQNALGDTPVRWQVEHREKIHLYEFASALVHGAIGAILVQYLYQRRGGYCHSIVADPELALKQVGAGSVKLVVHHEDSALTRRSNFISFLYLRNFEQVKSPFASIRSVDLSEVDYEKHLWRSDCIHPCDENTDTTDGMVNLFRTGPVFYGNPTVPFCVHDFVEMLKASIPQPPEVREALKKLQADLDQVVYTFIPEAGDMAIVNNAVVAHGRNGFVPGFLIPEGCEGVENKHLWIPVPSRWMIRVMSVVDVAELADRTHPENPFLILEEPTMGITLEALNNTLRYTNYQKIKTVDELLNVMAAPTVPLSTP